MKRRQFVHNTALATSSLFLLRCKFEQSKLNVEAQTGRKLGDLGLQLWSVRDLMNKDALANPECLDYFIDILNE